MLRCYRSCAMYFDLWDDWRKVVCDDQRSSHEVEFLCEVSRIACSSSNLHSLANRGDDEMEYE